MYVSIQFLRGLAAILVVWTHIYVYMLSIPNDSFVSNVKNTILYEHRYFGTIGVDIFFVISGFVVYLSAEKSSMHSTSHLLCTLRFILLRIIRVYPLYLVVFFIYILLKYILLSQSFDFSELLRSFFLFPNISNGEFNMVLGVAWTLTYEIYFYCLISLLMLFNRLNRLNVVLLLISINVLFGKNTDGIELFFNNKIIYEFLFGVILTLFLNVKNINLQSLFAVFFALSFSILYSIFHYKYFHDKFEEGRFIYLGVPAFLMVCFFLAVEMLIVERCKINCFSFNLRRLFVFLGEISYPLYLTHFSITIPILGKIFSRYGWWDDLNYLSINFIFIFSAFLFSFVVCSFCDKPITALFRGIINRRLPS